MAQTKELESALEGITSGLALFGKDNRLVLCNAMFQALYPGFGNPGMSIEDFLRAQYKQEVYFLDRRRGPDEPDEDLHHWLQYRLNAYVSAKSYTERMRDGRWIEITNTRSADGGIVSVHQDITEWKKDQENLQFLALHDSLTGLLNRASLQSHLARSLEEAKLNQTRLALMYVDVDDFKQINDNAGHDFGDEVLRSVAQILKNSVRAEDVVSRLGGDEFVVVFSNITTLDFIHDVAKRMIKNLSKGFSVSIGIAIYPEDAIDAVKLLNNADITMYAVKKSGKCGYKLYKDI